MAQRYLLNTPTSAVTFERGTKKIVALPDNSVVDLQQPLDGLQGLIEVTLNGETLLMFADDIRQRAKPLRGASA
jgi:hypothetical protein